MRYNVVLVDGKLVQEPKYFHKDSCDDLDRFMVCKMLYGQTSAELPERILVEGARAHIVFYDLWARCWSVLENPFGLLKGEYPPALGFVSAVEENILDFSAALLFSKMH